MPSIVQASATLSVVTGVPAEIANDGVASAQVTLVVNDGSGNPIEGVAASQCVLAVSGTGNTVTQPTGVTNANGQFASPGSFVSTTAEAKTCSYTVAGLAITDTAAVTVTGTPGAVYWAMDYGAGAAEAAGWEIGPNENAEVAISRQAAIGPVSEDGYRQTFASGGASGGDFGFGWGSVFPSAAPFAYGDRVYLRWKYRLASGTNGRFYEQGGGGALSPIGRTKFIIMNDGSSSVTSRFILNININRSPLSYFWYLGKGGGVDPAQTADLTVDTNWHTAQLELQYSSAEGVADGAYRIWIDNATQGSPDAEATGLVLNADMSPGFTKLGAYQNNSLYSDGVYGIDHVLFAITDAFTAGWE